MHPFLYKTVRSGIFVGLLLSTYNTHENSLLSALLVEESLGSGKTPRSLRGFANPDHVNYKILGRFRAIFNSSA